MDVGNFTTCVVGDLDESTEYFFAATAYTENGTESDYSNEVFWHERPHILPGQNTTVEKIN